MNLMDYNKQHFILKRDKASIYSKFYYSKNPSFSVIVFKNVIFREFYIRGDVDVILSSSHYYFKIILVFCKFLRNYNSCFRKQALTLLTFFWFFSLKPKSNRRGYISG